MEAVILGRYTRISLYHLGCLSTIYTNDVVVSAKSEDCRVAFKTGILCAIKTGLFFLRRKRGLEDRLVQQNQGLLLRVGS